MKSLQDRILDLLPDAAGGLSLPSAMERLRQDRVHVRAAFLALDKAGKARVFRRGRGRALYLAPTTAAILVCAADGCGKEFQRGEKSKRVTCSRACQAAYAWRDPVKAKARREMISVAHKSPAAKTRLAEHNKRRWSNPEEHERLRRQNSRRWKDNPEKFEEYRAKMRIIQSDPARKKFYSDMRKEFWADPVMREKMRSAAHKSQKTQEYRSRFSEYLTLRWQDPVMREKYTKANANRNNPELRKKNSERMKKLWTDPAFREKASAKVNGPKSREKAVATRKARGWWKKNRGENEQSP